MSKKGYEKWLIHIFLPAVWTRHYVYSDLILRALLLVDSHNSRNQLFCTALCAQNLVDIVAFLAHSSTTSQPLDLRVNSAFKKLLETKYKLSTDKDTEIQRAKLLSMSIMCLSSAQTSLYITEGFSRAGIWLFSKEALLNSAQ